MTRITFIAPTAPRMPAHAPKRPAALAATLAAGLLAIGLSTGAQAAAYIKFDGIDGEAILDAEGRDFVWTEALAGPDFNPFHGATAGGVNVAVGDLNGDGLDEIVMTAGLSGVGDVLQYQMTGTAGKPWYRVSDTAPRGVDLSFDSFESVTMRWRPVLATGGRGDWIEGRWDAATGRFTGDIAVLGAFDDLGATRWADGSLAITAAVPEPATWLLMLGGAGALAWRRRTAQA